MIRMIAAGAMALALGACSAAQQAKVDAFFIKVDEAAARSDVYLKTKVCPVVQTAAQIGTDMELIPARARPAVTQARAAFNVACTAPVTDVASAVVMAITAIRAAAAAGVAVPPVPAS